MKNTKNENYIIADTQSIDIKKTFECGQCFRWNADENGVYTGVAEGRVLKIWNEGTDVVCNAPTADIPFWRNYLDLDSDYISSKCSIEGTSDYLALCAAYGSGIHILRQEPWEALCSFIVSQCNNIPRIKKIVETLCKLYGDELEDGYFSFPSAHTVALLTESDLAPLRSGYRAAYILDAAKRVDDGRIDFNTLTELTGGEALNRIKEINGVGNKVANCFMLYGLHSMDRFPIDTWMKKAMTAHFPKDFDPTVLGSNAGLAQQYIFYFARSNEK